MSALEAERTAVQAPLPRYTEEAGWTYLTSEETLRPRRGVERAVLYKLPLDPFRRWDPSVVDLLQDEDAIRRLSYVLPTLKRHRRVWSAFRPGLSPTSMGERRT